MKGIRAWDQSGSYLAPVAEIDPVQLEGTTVTRASLSNLNVMKKLGIEVGKTVVVVKKGLVIPGIVKVLD